MGKGFGVTLNMKGTRKGVNLICYLTGMAVTGCPQEFQIPHSERVRLRMWIKQNDEEIKPTIKGKMEKRIGWSLNSQLEPSDDHENTSD